MRYYIASDLHLHDDEQPYLFTDAKQIIFGKLAAEVEQTGSTLVLAGDILDLTGLQRPAEGLRAFFRKVAPQALSGLKTDRRSVSERVEAIRRRFPAFFSALAPLARSRRLWMIPGNHDFELDTPEGRSALGSALGVPADALIFRGAYRVGDFLVTSHGHEFDESNRTSRGVENRGAVITRALYHAVVPALEALGLPSRTARAIPAVRPEENIVTGLEHYASQSKARELLVAFVELLRQNGYFTGFDSAKMWLVTRVLSSFVSPSQVRRALADDGDMKEICRRAADDVVTGRTRMAGSSGPPPRVVVLGHTHERDAGPSYVNLGTWIDHVVGIRPEELAKVDGSAPVVVTDGYRGALHDVLSLMATGSVERCPVLWTYGH